VTGENHLPPAGAEKCWFERVLKLIGPFENLSPVLPFPILQHKKS
jgi:hypothetical protein